MAVAYHKPTWYLLIGCLKKHTFFFWYSFFTTITKEKCSWLYMSSKLKRCQEPINIALPAVKSFWIILFNLVLNLSPSLENKEPNKFCTNGLSKEAVLEKFWNPISNIARLHFKTLSAANDLVAFLALFAKCDMELLNRKVLSFDDVGKTFTANPFQSDAYYISTKITMY